MLSLEFFYAVSILRMQLCVNCNYEFDLCTIYYIMNLNLHVRHTVHNYITFFIFGRFIYACQIYFDQKVPNKYTYIDLFICLYFNHILLNVYLFLLLNLASYVSLCVCVSVWHTLFLIYVHIQIQRNIRQNSYIRPNGYRQTMAPTHSFLSVSLLFYSISFCSARFCSLCVSVCFFRCCLSSFYSFDSIRFDSNRFNSIRPKVQTNGKFITFHHLMRSSDFFISFLLSAQG